MTSLKKTSILLSFEEEALKELRKVLFLKGLCPQEIFTFIVERLVIRDDKLETLLNECCAAKKEKLAKGGVDKKNISANSLYEAIEAGLEESR
jgi:hypothetical protein